jgi:hypothetical protein
MKELEIIYKGVLLFVTGEYTPSEELVYYYSDGSGYPGANSEFLIDSVLIEGVEISSLLKNEDFEKISEIVIAQLEN